MAFRVESEHFQILKQKEIVKMLSLCYEAGIGLSFRGCDLGLYHKTIC